jgi:DNA-binding MarR family transcriptional regulator
VRALHPDRLVATPSVSPGLLLARLGHGAMQLYRDSLAHTGLKPPHVAALVALRTELVGQQALGEATGLEPVKLVGILNDLESAGLVERRRDAVDRRRHIVAITCAGRDRLSEVERLSALAEERLLAGLTPAQRDQLALLLRLVADTTHAAEACPGTAEAVAGCAVDDDASAGACGGA